MKRLRTLTETVVRGLMSYLRCSCLLAFGGVRHVFAAWMRLSVADPRGGPRGHVPPGNCDHFFFLIQIEALTYDRE